MGQRRTVEAERTQYLRFAKFGHAYETFVIIDGHNTRYNRTSYSNLSTIINKLEENVSVIEKLGNNQISTSIKLKKQNKIK